MNMQQVMRAKLSANGYEHCRAEKDPNSKLWHGKMNSSKTISGAGLESTSHDRFIYITTCLIGHQVEVRVLDGSIFSGIFHATCADDFGIILKMARLSNDGCPGPEQRNITDSLHKRPSRTVIIPAKDLVQVIAKEVPVSRDYFANELHQEKLQELLTDSRISQSRHVEIGRELAPWVPDEDVPECPELENIFDGSWQRGWDQFEANATLFGVKSTFNEELYTTRLERGPQMRELEREASRIAREIEGEDTLDLHLAEERGLQLDEYLDIDEETRFSSVPRRVDDSGYDDIEDRELDSWNTETFGDNSISNLDKPLLDMNSKKTGCGGTYIPSLSEEQLPLASTSMDERNSSSEDHGQTEHLSKPTLVIEASRTSANQFIEHPESRWSEEDREKQQKIDHSQFPKGEGLHSLLRLKKESSDKTLSPDETTFDPSGPSSRGLEKSSSADEPSEFVVPPKTQGTSSHARPSSSASSTSDHGGAASTSASRGLTSHSSVGSSTSEKSTLNPHAKEFKLNPKAKSFIPSLPHLRPSSPIADNPYYYQPNMASVTQMHGVPVGIGIGPSFGAQQPVILNPQGSPMPQPYYHPNAPQYGQQMIVGQPRPVLYMPPPYPSEMPYKGRDY